MPALRDELSQHFVRWRNGLSLSWRERLECVSPGAKAVPLDVSLGKGERIVPVSGRHSGVFYALEGIDPLDVHVVVVGNDPYPHPDRATGRAFEQGDRTSWILDLAKPGCVTRSLLNFVCATAALCPDAAQLGLDSVKLKNRRRKLLSALRSGTVVLHPPRSMFENLTGQGVLWINRPPTISAHRRGHSWRAVKSQRKWHWRFWRPVIHDILGLLVEEARERTIVFALFGDEAKTLRHWIEAQGGRCGVPKENLRFVESGHPSVSRSFFCSGNPLARINRELSAHGCDPIDWPGPPLGQYVGSDSSRPLRQAGASASRANDPTSARASPRSGAIIDRTVGKYRATLKQLAER